MDRDLRFLLHILPWQTILVWSLMGILLAGVAAVSWVGLKWNVWRRGDIIEEYREAVEPQLNRIKKIGARLPPAPRVPTRRKLVVTEPLVLLQSHEGVLQSNPPIKGNAICLSEKQLRMFVANEAIDYDHSKLQGNEEWAAAIANNGGYSFNVESAATFADQAIKNDLSKYVNASAVENNLNAIANSRYLVVLRVKTLNAPEEVWDPQRKVTGNVTGAALVFNLPSGEYLGDVSFASSSSNLVDYEKAPAGKSRSVQDSIRDRALHDDLISNARTAIEAAIRTCSERGK